MPVETGATPGDIVFGLIAELSETRRAVNAWALLCKLSLSQAHDLHVQVVRLQQQNRRLRDELRAARPRLIRASAADAANTAA